MTKKRGIVVSYTTKIIIMAIIILLMLIGYAALKETGASFVDRIMNLFRS